MTNGVNFGASPGAGGLLPFRVLRRLVVFGFAVIQLVLVARILLDLGVIPADAGISGFIVTASDVLAAPVQGVGSGLSWIFGGDGLEFIAGDGLNPVMVVALIGWSVVEKLVLRVVGKFQEV